MTRDYATWLALHLQRASGYFESFNARFRDEVLNREIFYSLREAQIIIEGWRKNYNTKRPHSALPTTGTSRSTRP